MQYGEILLTVNISANICYISIGKHNCVFRQFSELWFLKSPCIFKICIGDSGDTTHHTSLGFAHLPQKCILKYLYKQKLDVNWYAFFKPTNLRGDDRMGESTPYIFFVEMLNPSFVHKRTSKIRRNYEGGLKIQYIHDERHNS